MKRIAKLFPVLFIVLPIAAMGAGVVFDAPGHVQTEGVATALHGGDPGATWTLLDWRGRDTGYSGVFDAEGAAVLPPLPCGYYRISPGSATLAVMPPPENRNRPHSSFYGIDSAQSAISGSGSFLCPWNGGDTYLTVSDLLWHLGIPHVRDRLSWPQSNPARGKFDYGNYMRNAEMLHARGILISDTFHSSPEWTRPKGKLPGDLNALFEFCASTAAAFGDRMGDWEFWNEEDVGFASEPVWDYAAALKAASLGFRTGRPGGVVLPGALCQSPGSPYMRILYENDAAKFCDVFNYHTYNPPAAYPEMFAALRKFMVDHGIGGRAVWMTESGTYLEGFSDTPGAIKGLMAHSPEQELVVAEFYPKSQIAFQMEGVARNYFFAFGTLNERNGMKDWGVMRRDGTVKPVYSAIGTMLRELAAARLAGALDTNDGFRAYLFDQPNGSQTVAFWTVSPVDTTSGEPSKGEAVKATPDYQGTITIPAADGAYRLSDLCGRQSTAVATNGVLTLESSRFPAYVGGLRGLIAKTPPHPAGDVEQYIPAQDEDLSVIIRVDLSTNDFSITRQKTQAALQGDSGRLRVEVWNMGDCAKTGRVEVAGGLVEGLPKTLHLGPRGTAPVSFDCTFVPAATGDFSQKLAFEGVFDGKRSSRLILPVRLDSLFLASCRRAPTSWAILKNWSLNTTAQSHALSWDDKEQAVRIDVSWTNSPALGRWFHPIFRLELPNESLADARMVQFEVKCAQDKVENDFIAQHLALRSKDASKNERILGYPAPIGSWEKRYVDLTEAAVLEDVAELRFGTRPAGMRCSLWIRNIEILRTP